MEKTIKNTSKTKSEVLKTLTINKKHKITIEKVLSGEYVGQYVVKSYLKFWFGLRTKSTTISAFDTDTNWNGKTTSANYPVFTFVSQAEDYLKHVKREFKFRMKKNLI